MELEEVVGKIRVACPGVIVIYLFGSYDTLYATPASDLDLALYSEQRYDPLHIWNLAQEIASFVGRDVDLVDLQSASTVFRYQVIATGRCIACYDDYKCNFFENMVISMYLDFNETRRELLEDYGKKQPR